MPKRGYFERHHPMNTTPRFFLRCLAPAALGLLLTGPALAQGNRLKTANKQFENFSYLNAVREYEDLLKGGGLTPTQRQEALTKLAYSYRRLQDSRNAERVYADLLAEFPHSDPENHLYYAQALAQNGKHRESQKVYAVYGDRQKADLRGKKFAVSYLDVNRFYQDSSSYKIEYLPINSRQSDFSPMYYRGGLAFVSARNEGGMLKRIFGSDKTPFLDLYFAPDTSELRIPAEAVGSGGMALGGSSTSDQAVETAPENARPLSKIEQFSRTLNTKYHEGPMTFNQAQNFIVFTRNNHNKNKTGKSSDGVTKLKLYSAELKPNGKWGNVKELPFNSDDYSCGHPAFSPDDKKLYFVSDKPGGFGGTDLYTVEFEDGKWGTPVNVGRELNTEGNEMFPYVDAHGNLYFASDGHEGIGGLDVFFAETRNGQKPKQVTNLGAPINSDKDDFGFICSTDRTAGYFSSNRKRGLNDDNLYAFRKTCKQLNVLVYDAATRKPLPNAQVRTVLNGENRDLAPTNASGAASLCLQTGGEYQFMALLDGYAPGSVAYSTRTNSSAHQTGLAIYLEKASTQLVRGVVKSEFTKRPMGGVEVTLEDEKTGARQKVVTGEDGSYEFAASEGSTHRIVAKKDNYAVNKLTVTKPQRGKVTETGLYGRGEVFQMNNIYYDLDKYFIRKDAAAELDRLGWILRQNPDMKIEVRSHTDARARDAYNLKLSQNRARAVVDYLVAKGISAKRLIHKGYGETELVNDCGNGVNCSEKMHQENRRTEFKIVAVK